MATALDLITAGAGNIGVSNLKSAEITTALGVLNTMIDSWNSERLTLFQEDEDQLTLTTASSYTIGSGGAFNITRPDRLISAFYRETSGTIDYPIRRFIDKAEWDLLPQKTLSGIPELIWYDTAYPLGSINIYPQKAGYLFLTSAEQLTEFAATSTSVSLPPGYREALIYNLSLRLGPVFELPVPQEVMMIASRSLGNIRSANKKKKGMALDFVNNTRTPNIRRGF
jgi:hypothetical protein